MRSCGGRSTHVRSVLANVAQRSHRPQVPQLQSLLEFRAVLGKPRNDVVDGVYAETHLCCPFAPIERRHDSLLERALCLVLDPTSLPFFPSPLPLPSPFPSLPSLPLNSLSVLDLSAVRTETPPPSPSLSQRVPLSMRPALFLSLCSLSLSLLLFPRNSASATRRLQIAAKRADAKVRSCQPSPLPPPPQCELTEPRRTRPLRKVQANEGSAGAMPGTRVCTCHTIHTSARARDIVKNGAETELYF